MVQDILLKQINRAETARRSRRKRLRDGGTSEHTHRHREYQEHKKKYGRRSPLDLLDEEPIDAREHEREADAKIPEYIDLDSTEELSEGLYSTLKFQIVDSLLDETVDSSLSWEPETSDTLVETYGTIRKESQIIKYIHYLDEEKNDEIMVIDGETPPIYVEIPGKETFLYTKIKEEFEA